MIVAGEWYPCPDGITRPIVYGSVSVPDGTMLGIRFLVDCGADQTMFTAWQTRQLVPEGDGTPSRVAGIGGFADSVTVETAVTLGSRGGSSVRLRGRFGGFVASDESELAILGRDVLDQFHVILSRRRDEVLLLFSNHDYQVITR
jgi:hypothetical protein